jgi:hypothetical protein
MGEQLGLFEAPDACERCRGLGLIGGLRVGDRVPCANCCEHEETEQRGRTVYCCRCGLMLTEETYELRPNDWDNVLTDDVIEMMTGHLFEKQ